MALKNTEREILVYADDHLRNHGFLFTEKGWILSPAYDINPVENATGLSLNISETDNSLDLDLAMEVIKYFRLSSKKAAQIIENVKNSVKTWKASAEQYKIPKAEQIIMAKAFYTEYFPICIFIILLCNGVL
jgi:serine/threonine-protein kinase HipA